MTEPVPTPEGVTPEGTPTPTEAPKPVTAEDLAKVTAALEKERETRKSFERQVKDFDEQRKATMTEAERAVIEAEERGRKSAVSAYGERLARTEFIAEAARRNPGFDAAAVLDDLNLARYIGEDGEPDSKAITAAVGRLVPEGSTGPTPPPSFDGGTRQAAASGVSMTQLIRQAAGRA
jgi:hypothetical protein